MSLNPALGDDYRSECERVGCTTGMFMRPSGPPFVHVTEDPERAWSRIAPYAVYDSTSYNSWQTRDHDNAVASDAVTADELRASGNWEVVTPDQCVELVRRNGVVALHPLMGGMPPELGWESLRLYVDRVLPQL
jgi:hypothetical protein